MQNIKMLYIQYDPGMNPHYTLPIDFRPSLWNKGNDTKISVDEILI
jgi:hypothetical protein